MAIKKPKKEVEDAFGKYCAAIGRRKTAIARVRIKTNAKQKQNIIVNGKNFTDSGGGLRAQAHASRHGLSRALVLLQSESKNILKTLGFLSRDSRQKERKKPGLKGARRAPQWSKR